MSKLPLHKIVMTVSWRAGHPFVDQMTGWAYLVKSGQAVAGLVEVRSASATIRRFHDRRAARPARPTARADRGAVRFGFQARG